MKKILNVGCGEGAKTDELAKLGEVIGIDISESALSKAKTIFPSSKFLLMDAEKMSFADDYFDEIHCYDVLEHVDNINPVMKEISRVIKPGGNLTVEIPNAESEKLLLKLNPSYFEEVHHARMISIKDAISLFNQSGFKVQSVIPKKFFDNLYLAYHFNLGRHVLNQQGGLSQLDEGERDRMVNFLNLLSQVPVSKAKKLADKKTITEIEKIFGTDFDSISASIKIMDELGSLIFPKTIRFECRYTGEKERREPFSENQPFKSETSMMEALQKNAYLETKALRNENEDLKMQLDEKNKELAIVKRDLDDILKSRGYKLLREFRKLGIKG